MTEFQKALNKETNKIDALVASMEDNALDLKNEIEMGIEDLERLERQKDPKLKFINPGDRQMKILKEIGDQERMTNQEIQNEAEELHMSLKEFEKYLAKEMEVEKYRMDQ